ncbi:hypothetical protein FHR72_001834 [Mycolicibacterium iranicum]|uniref:Secreted protein n=1 Tax=Mycolicibacterium iranicum TaxID=912594 RepID=A0A839Q818_MYCIR|nr:hypothetical protein [Mycolicibacterium iranicum]MBB2990366.1 hypothetical protein [Mycolicibacterium iranicum]
MVETSARPRAGRMHIPRSRGAVSGLLIVALGLWGALIPFVGPLFDFAFSPDRPWAWTAGRGWLEVLPGAVAVLGGLLMFVSRNRATAMLGTWMAVAAGAWFVVGRAVAGALGLGSAGEPVATGEAQRVWLELTYFSGLGALIVFLAALAAGRLSVRTARDIAYGEAHTHTVTNGPVGTDTNAWDRRDVAAEPVRRRRPSLFGRRRRDTRDTMPV